MGEEGCPEVGLSVLTRWCPPELIDAAIAKCGRYERRRRLLSTRMMVYFEMARCLFPHLGYEHVLRELVPADAEETGPWHVPNKSSLCRARRRVGPAVLQEVFDQVTGPMASLDACPSAFWRGLRLTAFDGTALAVADTPANAAAFLRKGANILEKYGYPQVELGILFEIGTHSIIAAAVGERDDNEITLASQLVPATGPNTLVLADRNMLGVELWHAFTSTGAHLLWRIRPKVARHRVGDLPDGSYLATVRIGSNRAKQRRRTNRDIPAQVTVRVIEYHLGEGRELYRLATSLLDPTLAPASELAVLYHQRWEAEVAYAKLKTQQRGTGTVLRSHYPDGIRQEIWAQLIVHHLTQTLIYHAAQATPPIDPDEISFRRAQQAVRRNLGRPLSPRWQRRALHRTVTELRSHPVEDRRHRHCPRRLKRVSARFARLRPGSRSSSPSTPLPTVTLAGKPP
ncbi:IS4 family transposase [Nonomuraea sp. NPDC051191]|uniref:IS4 family transposase n=1 Tax=Nonomuraea sp. NPDC051191 TaxID=3364372 RepID=UPI0037ADFAB4